MSEKSQSKLNSYKLIIQKLFLFCCHDIQVQSEINRGSKDRSDPVEGAVAKLVSCFYYSY